MQATFVIEPVRIIVWMLLLCKKNKTAYYFQGLQQVGAARPKKWLKNEAKASGPELGAVRPKPVQIITWADRTKREGS